MSIFCRHDYELIDKEVVEPPVKTLGISKVKCESSGYGLFSTTVIHIFKCSKCKKLKRMVTET